MTGPTVVAIGGNALIRRNGPDDVNAERRNAATAAASLAHLDAPGGLIVTHGNGPQVGTLAEGAEAIGHHTPMAVLVAQSQGEIGHILQSELTAVLGGWHPATVLTHVEVDPDDPAFAAPAKPIGVVLTEADAQLAVAVHDWHVVPDGNGWRRVIASPEPRAVIEEQTIRSLCGPGRLVVSAGGGGIPVEVMEPGLWQDLEAVVDKDLTSALLAIAVDAESLVILTDVDAVHRRWPAAATQPFAGHGGDATTAIDQANVTDLRELHFEVGTMGPKVEAACRFAEATGRPAHIGPLEHAVEVAAGRAGTTVLP